MAHQSHVPLAVAVAIILTHTQAHRVSIPLISRHQTRGCSGARLRQSGLVNGLVVHGDLAELEERVFVVDLGQRVGVHLVGAHEVDVRVAAPVGSNVLTSMSR